MNERVAYERIFLNKDSNTGIPVRESTAETDYQCRECTHMINKGNSYYYLILPDSDSKPSEKFLCLDCYQKHPGARLIRPRDGPGPNVLQLRWPNHSWTNKEI